MGLLACGAVAQSPTFTLDESGAWVEGPAPEAGTDAWVMAEVRRLIAEDLPSQARQMIGAWLRKNSGTDNPWLAQGYLLRGDAKAAMGDEYEALFDYEVVIRGYPASEEFVTAVEREVEIALRYGYGLRRKVFFGLVRLGETQLVAQELLVRAAERLPGSEIAERATIELADFYYRTRQLTFAADTYDVFLLNFPQSRYRKRALARQVLSNLSRYKGPAYDATPLEEARLLIRDFRERFPLDSREAGLDESLLAKIDESQGAQMLETARYYMRSGDMVSAQFQLRQLAAKHPRTAAAAAAREIIEQRGWGDPDTGGVQGPATPGAAR